jgi:glyoxylase-like metal-dependent hydrolase (beta-lactamase superfamily II)
MRNLLRLATLLVAILTPLAVAASEIVAGVHLVRGAFAPGAQPDGNSVVFETPEGLVVVDTGRHAAHTRAILDLALRLDRPVVAIVNTHWHLDHIGGNGAIRAAYPAARIHATAALAEALGGFLSNYRRQLVEAIGSATPEQKASHEAEIARIDAAAKLPPDVVLAKSGRQSIGGRAFRIGVETKAVTAADAWLLDEATGILVAGDLVTLPAPFLDTACPSRWGDAIDRLRDAEFDLLVPGHGAPMTRRQFVTYVSAFRSLLRCAAAESPKEACIDGWLTAVSPLESSRRDEAFLRSVTGYYVDLLRSGSERLKPLCE